MRSFSIARRYLVAGFLVLTAALAISLSAASRANAATDVMFVFDTSGSMGGAIEETSKEMQVVMSQASASIPDIQFGLAEMKDYPHDAINYNGSPEEFEYDDEFPGTFPWKLIAPISPNQSAVNEGLLKFEAEGGGDTPESYGRALFETAFNPSVGWRPGARGIMVLIADDVPHDNELNEGIPPELWFECPFVTGPDPGPDNTLNTGDDIDWQGLLARLATEGKPLEYVDYQGEEGYFPYWQNWTGRTGGIALNSDDETNLIADLVEAIKSGASAALPACPSGQVRDANGKCVLAPPPPSNNFKFDLRISCSKGCHVVTVKIVFDSAGNVLWESVVEEEAGAASISAAGKKGKAKGKCGKKSKKGKKCKRPALVKKSSKAVVAGENRLELKLTGPAIAALKKAGKVKLPVKFTFTPTGGTPKSSVATYVVKAPKKGKGKKKGRK